MVFIPSEHRYFSREYYRAYQRANTNVPPADPASGSETIKTKANLQNLKNEWEAGTPVAAVKSRPRRKPKESRRREAEKRDIVAARLRGGLVQYMLKMGYPMEQAMREATRAVAQMIDIDRLGEDAASRQVFLANASTRPFIANNNHDLMADLLKIATKPLAYVDFDV